MIPTAEQATVYRGGGRRWLTRRAACKAEARAKIKARCECSEGDYITPPDICFYHDADRYPKVLRRLTRLYESAFLAQQGKGKP